jgi:glutamine synthetase
MADTDNVLDMIQEHDVKYVDFRFTDPRGKWQHLAHHVRTITDEFLSDGVPFDGSSIAGWKAINESDMLLVPDCETAVLDPFAAQTSLILFCDVHEPLTGQPYSRDPRSVAKKAEQHLIATGIGDKAFFGPEAEFFVFDDVRYKSTMNGAMYEIDSEEGPYVTAKEYPDGNMGHRPPIKGGYFPVPPVDSASDLRAEMLSVMLDMGLEVEKHHHEVAPSQHELGFVYSTLVKTADNMQIYKYVVHNVAHQYGKTATFMPKPIKGDNGSGMHTHQSIWKGERPLFAGNQYADLSDNTPICRRRHCITLAASSGTPRRSTPSQTRRQTVTSGSFPVSRRRCCWPIRRATARPRAASRSFRARRRNGSRCAFRTRRPIRTWPMPR